MSQPYDDSQDPIVDTKQIEIAGCLMRIDTTRSGIVLVNGDRVEAFTAQQIKTQQSLGQNFREKS